MRLATGRCRKLAAVASGAAIAAGFTPALHGTPAPFDLALAPVAISGDTVEVLISNAGLVPRSGVVRVEAMLAGGRAFAETRFFVGGGQKVFVNVAMGSEVVAILELGAVLDDGAPF